MAKKNSRDVNLEVYAYRNMDADCIDIYIRGETIGVPRDRVICEDLLLRSKKPEEENAVLPPSFNISIEEAQKLMNSLWEAGLRPVQGHGSVGQLRATQDHLNDMRRLVGKAHDVEFKE